MRPLLELHARCRQLRHLAKRLLALPRSPARNAHRPAGSGGPRRSGQRRRRVSFPAPLKLPWLLLLSVFVFTLDRLTKDWVGAHVVLGGAIPVFDHLLRITHWTNEGAAFSMFADSASPHT